MNNTNDRKGAFDPTPYMVGIAILFALFYFGSCAHTLATCHHGHVVKNFFDWPVCLTDKP